MTAQWPLQRSPRCWCGRRVSWDGVECAEHDDPPADLAACIERHPAGKALPNEAGVGLDPAREIPARFDERYDPSPEPIDRKTR